MTTYSVINPALFSIKNSNRVLYLQIPVVHVHVCVLLLEESFRGAKCEVIPVSVSCEKDDFMFHANLKLVCSTCLWGKDLVELVEQFLLSEICPHGLMIVG